ncbi:MAG: hypothetical protein AB1758_10690, partial [Candidatus Eremiobacterota bacterium]
ASFWYLRNIAHSGRPWMFNEDPENFPLHFSQLEQTLPGFRTLPEYLWPDLALWADPYDPSAYTSFWGTVYGSVWWDYFRAFLPHDQPAPGRLLLALGVVPTVLALWGLYHRLFEGPWKDWWPFLALAGMGMAVDLGMTFRLQHFAAVKGSYLYPAFLPAALAAADRLEALRVTHPRLAVALRLLLSLSGLLIGAVFWWRDL